MKPFPLHDTFLIKSSHNFIIIHPLNSRKWVDNNQSVPHIGVDFFILESSPQEHQNLCCVYHI